MTLMNEDISAARRAVASLERVTEALLRHYGNTVDTRRLRADVGRLAADLDLLCGATVPATSSGAAASAPEVIPDTSYSHDFWMDAEDEGLGRYEGRGR